MQSFFFLSFLFVENTHQTEQLNSPDNILYYQVAAPGTASLVKEEEERDVWREKSKSLAARHCLRMGLAFARIMVEEILHCGCWKTVPVYYRNGKVCFAMMHRP